MPAESELNPPPSKPDGGVPGEHQSVQPEPATELVIPEACWRGPFGDYRRAMQGATEAPDAFHFATLLVVAAMALGRRVFFDYSMRLYPNS